MKKPAFKTALQKADPRLIKFFLVGGLNTAFGYAAFVFYVWLGFGIVLAPLLGTITGMLFNFKTIGVLVFKNHDNKLILRFFAVYAVTYLVNVAGLKIFELCGLKNLYIGGLILIVPVALLAFYLHKNFVFERGQK